MKIERKRFLEWNSKKTFELGDEEMILTFRSIKGGSTLRIPYTDIDPSLIDYKIAYAPYNSIAFFVIIIAAITSFLDLPNPLTFSLMGVSMLYWGLYIFAKRSYKGFMNRNHKTQSLFFIEMDSTKETEDFFKALEQKLN